MQQNRNLHIHLHLHTFLHVGFVLNHVGGSLHDRRFSGANAIFRLAHKAPVTQAMWGAIVVGTGLTGSNISHLIYCGAVFVVLPRWHFGCLKRHHSLLSKSAMGLKFTITGLLFQALLIVLFSVLVDYSDNALPSHSRKGASRNVNVTTETLPVNDVSVYYPSKIVCFACNSCFIRLRIRSIPTSPGFYFEC